MKKQYTPLEALHTLLGHPVTLHELAMYEEDFVRKLRELPHQWYAGESKKHQRIPEHTHYRNSIIKFLRLQMPFQHD